MKVKRSLDAGGRGVQVEDGSTIQSIKHFGKLVDAMMALIVIALLVLPIVALYRLSNTDEQSSPFSAAGLLIVFTFLFGMAMFGLTKASRQETFAASAGYCAVLVVFISGFNTQKVEIVG